MRSSRFSPLRVAALIGLGLTLTAAQASAAITEIRILLDLDNDPATGCTVITADGSFGGVEQVLRTVADTSTSLVTGVDRQECIDPGTSTFGGAIPVDPAGWPLGVGNGVDGTHVVETFFPLSAAPGRPRVVRLAVAASDEAGGEDALITSAPAGGQPIRLDLLGILEIPTLAPWSLLLLGMLLAAAALVLLRRRSAAAAALALVLLCAAGAAWAACMLDGAVDDWGALPPLAEDGLADGPAGADLRAFFGKQDGVVLCFRVDLGLVFNQPPTADAQMTLTDEDVPLVITLTGSDPDADPLTFAVATGPANGSLGAVTPAGPTSATVTYTPDPNFNGSDSFTFSANDGAVDSTPATVDIQVQPVNDPPTADTQMTLTDEDVPLLITLTGSDPEGDPLTFAIATGPANGSLGAVTPTGPTSATVTYTPNLNFNGADSFTFIANDGTVDSTPATVDIQVQPVNDPPAADAQMTLTDEDVPLVITLTGSDPDADPLTFAVATGPSNGSLGAVTPAGPTSATVTYTPDPNFNGNDSFTFTANDGTVDSAPATVDIQVQPGNDPPTDITLSNAMVDENSALGTVIGILDGVDPDAGETFTFLEVTDPDLKFAVVGNELRVDGALNFEAKSSHTVEIQVTDSGGLMFTKSFVISVKDVPEAPIAVLDSFLAIGNTLLHALPTGAIGAPPAGRAATTDPAGVLDNDTDPDLGAMLAVKPPFPTSSVKGGSVTMNADGSFSYVPPKGVQAPPGDLDSFAYTLTDGTFDVPGMVEIEIAQMVWYVDNTGSPAGDGTSANPFDELKKAEIEPLAGPGHTLFVHTGDGTKTKQSDGIVLEGNQRLIGQGVALTVDPGGGPVTLLPAGAPPVITNTNAGDPDQVGVTLADGNTVSGLTVDGAGGHGVAGTNVQGTLKLASLLLSANGGQGLFIDNDNMGSPLSLAIDSGTTTFDRNTGGGLSIRNNVMGNVTLTSAVFTGSSGTALELLNTTGNLTASGTLNRTGGRVLDFNGTSGTFDLTGLPMTASDADAALLGLALNNATGSYTFGLVNLIKDVAGSGFGGPAVSVTSSPGAVSFPGGLTASGVAGDGVFLQANDGGSFAASNLSLTTTAGRGLFAGNAGVATAPMILIGGTSSIHATGGAALDIDTATLAATFSSLGSSGSSAQGLRVVNSTGMMSSSSTTISTPGSDGIFLQGNPGASINLGTLANLTTTAGRGLFADSTGTVTVTNSPSISATGGEALDVRNTSVGGGWGFGNVSSAASPGSGVNLDNVTGGISATGGSISGAAGIAFRVNAGGNDVTYGGSISNTTNRSVSVTNRTAGTVSFNGPITDSGSGILVSTNPGGATRFNGNLSLTTGANGAFTATNGGQVSTMGGTNTLATTTGVALTVTGTTIGTDGLTFRSISAGTAASGPTHGIVLTDTGTLGGLTVTGTGAAGSGGTIQRTDQGIVLTNTRNVSLAFMNLTNANLGDGGGAGVCDGNTNAGCKGAINMSMVLNVALDNLSINGAEEMGINGRNVTHFALSNSSIQNAGNAINEHGLHIRELLGTAAGGTESSIVNTTITNSNNHNAFIVNSTATSADPANPDLLLVLGSTFSNLPAPNGANGLLHESRNAGNMHLEISGSSLVDNRGIGVNVQAAQGGRNHVTAMANTLHSSTVTAGAPEPFQDLGILVGATQTSTATFDISNNPEFRSRDSHHVRIIGFDTASLRGTVSNNPNMNGSVNGSGVSAVLEGGSTGVITISGNIIGGLQFGRGIDLQSRSGAGSLDVTLSGNNINTAISSGTFANHGVFAAAGNGDPGESNRLCIHYVGNTSTGGTGRDGYRVEQFAGTTFQIENLIPASGATSAQVAAHIVSQNTAGTASVTPADALAGTVVSYTAGTCATP